MIQALVDYSYIELLSGETILPQSPDEWDNNKLVTFQFKLNMIVLIINRSITNISGNFSPKNAISWIHSDLCRLFCWIHGFFYRLVFHIYHPSYYETNCTREEERCQRTHEDDGFANMDELVLPLFRCCAIRHVYPDHYCGPDWSGMERRTRQSSGLFRPFSHLPLFLLLLHGSHCFPIYHFYAFQQS